MELYNVLLLIYDPDIGLKKNLILCGFCMALMKIDKAMSRLLREPQILGLKDNEAKVIDLGETIKNFPITGNFRVLGEAFIRNFNTKRIKITNCYRIVVVNKSIIL